MPQKQVSRLFQSSTETTEPELAQINGSIPEWLSGTFLRTGPAKWDLDESEFTFNHFLDGYAMISKFTINSSGQTVTFEKKFLQSDAYVRGIAARRPVLTEYGTPSYPDPSKSFFSKMLCACLPIELSDNNSSALFQLGREFFTTSETCYFRALDPCTLTSGQKYDSNKCFGVNIDSAHPITDEIGTTWNMGSTFLMGLKYNIYKIPAPASNQSAQDMMRKSKIVASIPSSWNGLMSYNHQSFVLTANYIVFIEQPFVMNIGKAAKSILKGSSTFSQYVEWRPELGNRFFVIEKNSGKILKTEFYAAQSFFFLHYINAYEENNQVVLDLISYNNPNIFDDLYMDKLRSGKVMEGKQGSAHRYVIPLCDLNEMEVDVNLVAVKSDAHAIRCGSRVILRPEILTQPGIEFPLVNKKQAGKKHKYFYGIGTLADTLYKNCIMKYDLSSKSSITWAGNPGQFPGEPQLILNPNGKTEDDGILISAVSDERSTAQDFVVFINARSMTEVGRAQFKNGVPLAQHGIFLTSGDKI